MWVGIDFGTSNSCAALVADETLKMVEEPESGRYSIPSSVFVEGNGQVLVGQAAEHMRRFDSTCYQSEFKLRLGQEEAFVLGSHRKYPVDLVAEVLKKLKSEAEQQITHEQIFSAIITVPANYEKPLRELMQRAAQQAGFEQVKLLDEPVAAAVYYASQPGHKVKDGEIFLVYDLGGGTFDAALVRRKGLRYELVTAPDGRKIGGVDFDSSIYADFLAKCPSILRDKLSQRRYRLARLTLHDECRTLKHTLSTVSESGIRVPVLGQVVDYSLCRQEFIHMIAERIDETITCCEALLRRDNTRSENVRCVLLVGGSCRIPYIRECLQERLNIDVFPVADPELAVCMGAALYGDALDRADDFVKEVDTLCASQQFHAVLHEHLPELFQNLARPLAQGIAQKAAKPTLQAWQGGSIRSLNDIQPAIESKTKAWIASTACQKKIRSISIEWIQKRISQFATLSDPICDRYRVSRDILRLPEHIPQLESGLPSTPLKGDGLVNTDAISGWVGLIVAIVVGIIVAHIHILAALAGPVGFIVAAVAFIFGAGKTEELIREAELPVWVRKMVLSDEKMSTQVQNVQTKLATSMVSEMEKNKAEFEKFVTEIRRILQTAIHEQAIREARFIWLHEGDE